MSEVYMGWVFLRRDGTCREGFTGNRAPGRVLVRWDQVLRRWRQPDLVAFPSPMAAAVHGMVTGADPIVARVECSDRVKLHSGGLLLDDAPFSWLTCGRRTTLSIRPVLHTLHGFASWMADKGNLSVDVKMAVDNHNPLISIVRTYARATFDLNELDDELHRRLLEA